MDLSLNGDDENSVPHLPESANSAGSSVSTDMEVEKAFKMSEFFNLIFFVFVENFYEYIRLERMQRIGV